MRTRVHERANKRRDDVMERVVGGLQGGTLNADANEQAEARSDASWGRQSAASVTKISISRPPQGQRFEEKLRCVHNNPSAFRRKDLGGIRSERRSPSPRRFCNTRGALHGGRLKSAAPQPATAACFLRTVLRRVSAVAKFVPNAH
ncbi:hypothetical protein MRX96_054238 [Rhipicephalus microplus]